MRIAWTVDECLFSEGICLQQVSESLAKVVGTFNFGLILKRWVVATRMEHLFGIMCLAEELVRRLLKVPSARRERHPGRPFLNAHIFELTQHGIKLRVHVL